MDPLADKILICSAFIALVERGHVAPNCPLTAKTSLVSVEAWMAVVIVARELAITGLRLLAAAKSVVLAAEGWGKHKTISQIVAIIALLVSISYQQWDVVGRTIFGFAIAGKPWVDWFTPASIWVAVILTFISGWLYLWRNRKIYLSDM